MQTEPESIKILILGYFNKYLTEFRVNLDTAIQDYDPEAIHDYRVAVKRIRAIIRSLNKSYEEPLFSEKNILPLRKMFKAGGTIRDDQVQIGLVEKIENEFSRSFPLIKKFYQKRIKDQRDTFFKTSVEFDFDILDDILQEIEIIIEPLDDEYLEINLYNRLRRSMEKLKRIRYDLDAPEKLHSFRTRFKENGYVAEMLFQSKQSHKVTKATYTRMKDFGQELGDWHDHYQLWSKTAFIFNESKNTELLGEAFELRILITPVHDKLFQEILHLIKRDDSLFLI
jgi:CHAD domain-containing protein